MNPSLVVSIHDVSPLTWKTTETMLRELADCGVVRTSLLVVPNHHRRGHFMEDAAFCDWLKQKDADGHETIIHGYYHRRERRDGETLAGKLTTRVYTADEGEFYDIGEAEAFESVSRAKAEFARIGLAPPGFIAPAWLLSVAGEEALRRAEIEYTTRLTHVQDLRTGTIHHSQSMVYSVRSAWRRIVSLGWNALLYRRLQTNPLLRIGIHPPDHSYPSIWRQILHYASQAAQKRDVLTYWEWIERIR